MDMVAMASAATTCFPIASLQSTTSTAKCTKHYCGRGLFKSKHNIIIAGGGLQLVEAINNNNVNKVVTSSDDELINPFEELMAHHDAVYRENFNIRSYEVDAHRTASIQTLLNLLQETALNRSRKSGLLADGFGNCTPKMQEMGLLWVFIRMQIVIDSYPMWGDVVQVNNWISTLKKNSFRFDWLMRHYQTGQILTRASCVSVMMNKLTRRLCRVPEEVRQELASHLVNSSPIILQQEDYNTEIPKLDDDSADYVCSGLRATRNDLDVNHHVNNVKYVRWILKSVPERMWESHEVGAMTLEYKRECGRDSKLHSLTQIISSANNGNNVNNNIGCHHLLRFDEENCAEVVRGRTLWRPK